MSSTALSPVLTPFSLFYTLVYCYSRQTFQSCVSVCASLEVRSEEKYHTILHSPYPSLFSGVDSVEPAAQCWDQVA